MAKLQRRSARRHNEPRGRLIFSRCHKLCWFHPTRGLGHRVRDIGSADLLHQRGDIDVDDLDAAREFFSSTDWQK